MSCRAAPLRCVFLAVSIATVAALSGAGCSTDDGSPAATVRVTATDTTCALHTASVPAGTIRFAVENRGSIITEVYLLGERDRVVNEVENIEPGEDGDFTVTTGGGRYTVNCKPGQIGDGIRADLEVTGEPATDQLAETDPATARGLSGFTMALTLHDEGFADQFAELVVVTGQVVTFELSNDGTAPHALAVLAPDGVTTLARSDPIAPGATAKVPVAFAQAGTHTAADPLNDQPARGLEAMFRVID